MRTPQPGTLRKNTGERREEVGNPIGFVPFFHRRVKEKKLKEKRKSGRGGSFSGGACWKKGAVMVLFKTKVPEIPRGKGCGVISEGGPRGAGGGGINKPGGGHGTGDAGGEG